MVAAGFRGFRRRGLIDALPCPWEACKTVRRKSADHQQHNDVKYGMRAAGRRSRPWVGAASECLPTGLRRPCPARAPQARGTDHTGEAADKEGCHANIGLKRRAPCHRAVDVSQGKPSSAQAEHADGKCECGETPVDQPDYSHANIPALCLPLRQRTG